MPTLIEKGSIGIPKGTPKQEADRINNMVAIDYVMERVGVHLEPARHWSDKILILIAGTGSGKSVSIPTIYLRYGNEIGRNMIVTQPKIISAVKTVQDDIVKVYSEFKLGKNIGYQTSSIVRKPIKGVVYTTIGILLQQFKTMTSEQIINKYSCIVIDEAHERTTDVDLTLYFIKDLIKNNWDNPRCPIIVLMSATLETDRFLKYFGDVGGRPEVLTVLGKTYPVDEYFLKNPSNNYIWTILDKVRDIHNDNVADFDSSVRDILIFVSGEAQITRITNELHKMNNDFAHKIFPLKLTSQVYSEGGKDLQDIEAPLHTLRILGKTPQRKVIVATNVAETSLTIESLKYVIDSGFRLAVEFEPCGFTISVVKPVSRDMAKQRRGRVGRVAPGKWYPIFTEESFNRMQEAKFPDIITTETTMVILSLIVKNTYFDTAHIDLMDSFPGETLHYSMEKLYSVGAIKIGTREDKLERETLEEGEPNIIGRIIPTDLGKVMNRFRKVTVENIKMIVAGYHYGANILDLITIAILSSTVKLKSRDYKLREVLSESRRALMINDSFIDYIFLFEEFRKQIINLNKVEQWCIDNAISFGEMLERIKERDELIEDMVFNIGFDPLYNGLGIDPAEYSLRDLLIKEPDIGVEEVIKIKKCIMAGYRTNLAILDETETKYMAIGREIMRPPALLETPRYFIYSSLNMTMGKNGAIYKCGNFSVMDNFVQIDLTR